MERLVLQLSPVSDAFIAHFAQQLNMMPDLLLNTIAETISTTLNNHLRDMFGMPNLPEDGEDEMPEINAYFRKLKFFFTILGRATVMRPVQFHEEWVPARPKFAKAILKWLCIPGIQDEYRQFSRGCNYRKLEYSGQSKEVWRQAMRQAIQDDAVAFADIHHHERDEVHKLGQAATATVASLAAKEVTSGELLTRFLASFSEVQRSAMQLSNRNMQHVRCSKRNSIVCPNSPCMLSIMALLATSVKL